MGVTKNSVHVSMGTVNTLMYFNAIRFLSSISYILFCTGPNCYSLHFFFAVLPLQTF